MSSSVVTRKELSRNAIYNAWPQRQMQLIDDPIVLGILEKVLRLAQEAYVVGGTVRDLVMGGPTVNDIDVAIPGDGYELARTIAAEMGASVSFVPLDRGRGTARLVIDRGRGATIDVSRFKGPTFVQDLCLRDFTINAMGISIAGFLRGDVSDLKDPLGGIADIRDRTIRACSPRSLEDDPLRVLRAFRFQAKLGFQIDPETVRLFPPAKEKFAAVAGERIRDELMAILRTDRAAAILGLMRGAGVAGLLFPELVPLFGCAQNSFHHLDVWDHTLETVRLVGVVGSEKPGCLAEFSLEIEQYLSQEIVKGRPNGALVNLAALFHDAGKPRVKTVDSDGRIRFFGHEKVSRTILESVGNRLRLSNREVRCVANLIEGHMRPFVLLSREISRKALYRLVRHFGDDVPGLVMLFLGDLGASRGPDREGGTYPKAVQEACRVLKLWRESKSPAPEPLLRGDDIMGLFGLEPGPFLGSLLRRVNELHACGEFATRADAILAITGWIDEVRHSPID